MCSVLTLIDGEASKGSHSGDGQPTSSVADPLGPLVTPVTSCALNLTSPPYPFTSSPPPAGATGPPPPPPAPPTPAIPSTFPHGTLQAASSLPPSRPDLNRALSQPPPSLVARPITNSRPSTATIPHRALYRDHLPNPTWPTPGDELTPTEVVMHSETVLFAKLQWTIHELKKSQSVEQSIQLCHLVTACGEALKSLQEVSKLHSSPTTDTS